MGKGRISIGLMAGYMACMKRLVMLVLQHVRRCSNLSSRLSMIRSRRLFCKDRLRRKRSSVADSVAVAEVSVLPFHLEEVLMQARGSPGGDSSQTQSSRGPAGDNHKPTSLHVPWKSFRAGSPIKM